MANKLTKQGHTTKRYNLRDRRPGGHASTIATVKRTSATPVEKDEKAARGATHNGKRRKVNSGDGDQKDMQSYNDEDTMELCGDEHNIELSNGLEQNLDTGKEKDHNPDPSALEKQKDLSPSLLTTVVSRGEESAVARDNYSNPLKRKHSSGPVDIGTLLMLKPDVKAKVKDMEDHLASNRLDIYHLCQLQLFALMGEDVPFVQLRDGLPGLSKVVLDEMTKGRLLSNIRDGSKELDIEYEVSNIDDKQKKNWGQWDLLSDAVTKAMKAAGKLDPGLTEAEIRSLSDSTVPTPVPTQAPTKIKAYLAFVAHRSDLVKKEKDWLQKTFVPVYPVGDRTVKEYHPKGQQVSHDDQTGQTQMDDEFANLKSQVESLQKLVKEKNEQIEKLKISEDERQVKLQLQSEMGSTDGAPIEIAEEKLRELKKSNKMLAADIISIRQEKKMLDAKIDKQNKEKTELESLLTNHRSSDFERVEQLSQKREDIFKLERSLEQKDEDIKELKKQYSSREKENESLIAQKQTEITTLTEEFNRLTARQREEERKLKTSSEELQHQLNQMESEKKNLKKDLERVSMDKQRFQLEAGERTNAMSKMHKYKLESHNYMLESQEKSKKLALMEIASEALKANYQKTKQSAEEREKMIVTEADGLRGKQIKLEAELKEKKEELKDIETKFRESEKKATDLNSKFATEKAAREEERKRLENEDKNRDETIFQLQAAKRLVEAELKDTKAHLEEATKRISTLEKEQKDRQTHAEINEVLKGKLMSVLPTREGLTGAQRPQELPAIVDDVITAAEEIRLKGSEIEKKLRDLEARNLALQTLEKSINGSEDVPKHQHDSLMLDYDKVLKEKTELESQLSSIKKQALEEKAKGDGQLTAKDATIQELKRTIESLTKSRERAEESISTIKMSSGKLEKEIEELQRKNKQAEQEKEDIKQSCHSENGSIRKRLEDAEKMLQTAQHETEEQASLREKKFQDQLTAYHAENVELHRGIHELTEKNRLHEKDAESQNTLALKTKETLQGEVAKLRGELKKSKTLEDRLQSQIKDLEEAKKLLKDKAKRRVGLVNDDISHKANLENGVCGSITNEKRPSKTFSLNALGKSAEQKSHKSATDEASLHRQAPLRLSKCDGPVEAHAGEKQDQGSLSEDDSDTPGSPWGTIQDVRSSSLPASREDQHLSWGESDRATTNMLYSQGPRLNSRGPQENPAVQELLSKAMAQNRANGTGIPPLSQKNPRSNSIGINSTSHSGQLQLVEHPQVRDSYEGSNRAQVPGPVVRADTRNAPSRLQTRKPTYSGGDFAPLSGSSGSPPPSSNPFPKMQISDDMQSMLDELKKSIEKVDKKVSKIKYRSSQEVSKRKTSESPELDEEEGQVSKRQRNRRNVRPEDTQARIYSSEKESRAKSRKTASRRKVKVKAVNKEVIEVIPSPPKKDILILDDKKWIIDRITNHNAKTTYIHLKMPLREECKLTLLQALSLGTNETYKKNNEQLREIYKRNEWAMPDALAFSTMHATKGTKFEVSFEDRDNKAKTEVSANKLLNWGYRAAHEMGDKYVDDFETNEDLERYRKNALSKLSIRKDIKS